MAKVRAHRSYMRNRAKNKVRARKRYKKMRNNPVFKRKQLLRRRNPARFKRIALEIVNLPFWSPAMGDGTVVGADEDEVFYTLVAAPDEVRVLDHQHFLDSSYFLDETDINRFFDLLDNTLGLSYEARAVSDAMAKMLEGGPDA